ncbi:hypothetical protein ACSBR1_015380 [Camellia fascicularis]
MVMKKTMGGSVCAVEWVMVILALIASSVTVNATITCQDAILKILPCEPYLLGIGDITVPCCQGAQNLNQMVNSTADRRAVCACFKQVGPSLGVNVDRAKKLPDLCKIDLRGITIDFTIDCSTIPFGKFWYPCVEEKLLHRLATTIFLGMLAVRIPMRYISLD